MGQVLDQVEECGLGPVDVLEEDNEGAFAGERREEPACFPEDLLAFDRTPGDRLLKTLRDRPSLIPLAERVALSELADDLPQGPEGDALAVRDAAAHHDARAIGDQIGELLSKPGFSDPGHTE